MPLSTPAEGREVAETGPYHRRRQHHARRTGLVHVEMYDNNLIYHRGDVVYEERLTAQELSNNAELQVMRFLHNVNQQAQAKGLLPDR